MQSSFLFFILFCSKKNENRGKKNSEKVREKKKTTSAQ